MATTSPREFSKLPSLPTLGVFDPLQEAGRLFEFLKSAQSLNELQSRVIEFQLPDARFFQLTPVSVIHLDNDAVHRNLLNWRQGFPDVFDSVSELTVAGTKEWLRDQVVNNPDRILFLIEDSTHRYHGHLGLWVRDGWRFELDNVVKSPDSDEKALMSYATKAVGRWCNEFLGLDELYLRVLSDNFHAIQFYSKLGFNSRLTIPASDSSPILEADLDDPRSVGILDSNRDDRKWIVMSASLEAWNSQDSIILTAGPSIGPLEVSLVSDAVRSGWNHHHSDYLMEFAESFGEYVGAKYAIPTDSCTSALHLALWALGVGPGDEVIVPEITWVATANAARYVGATPIFADIDPVTWCMDPTSLESLITSRTKAVIPVHLYGYVANLFEISEICRKHGLSLVQDAAPGIGSMTGAEGVASFGDFTCFSFQGAKLLVSGEGGVLTTNDESLFEAAFKIGDSGRRPGTFWIDLLGKKMKMSNPTASLALAQLISAERQIARKRRIRDWYVEDLNDLPNVAFQAEAEGTRSICWMTSIVVNEEKFDREAFRAKLLAMGVDTRPVFSPISRYPYWAQRQEEGVVAARIGDNAVNLPSGVGLSRATISRVTQSIRDVLTG